MLNSKHTRLCYFAYRLNITSNYRARLPCGAFPFRSPRVLAAHKATSRSRALIPASWLHTSCGHQPFPALQRPQMRKSRLRCEFRICSLLPSHKGWGCKPYAATHHPRTATWLFSTHPFGMPLACFPFAFATHGA